MFTFEVTELLQFIRAKDIFICDVCVYAFANAECVCVCLFQSFFPRSLHCSLCIMDLIDLQSDH